MRRQERNRILENTAVVKMFVFFAVLLIMAIVGLIIPLRPTTSDLEKRELNKFPSFSVASLLDGSYFSGIDSWYSDTFPFREQLLAGNSVMQSLNGIGSVQIHGTIEKADEIPDDNGGKIASLDELPSEEASSEAVPSTVVDEPEKPVTNETDNGNISTQTLGAVFVAGNAAYEIYGFNQSASEQYAAVINYAADMFKGIANVYDVIVPNSMGVVLSDKVKENIKTSNQNDAINYMFSVMSDNVKKVNIYDTLMAHRDEYIYFRTDHHWTQRGAYYAYVQYCKAKGITAKSLDAYECITFDGFLGSFYADTGQAPELGNTPDVVYAYYPKSTNSMTFVDKSGKENNWKVIQDVTSWAAGSKYGTFIGGDNPLATIVNPEINDGSACVVIKESYGNAFVPFLVDHYQYVYVIDYRYYKGKLYDFVTENHVQDVIYINNIMATGTKLRIDDMIRITKQ